jgi:4-amino-4-deoxychorismate lyase
LEIPIYTSSIEGLELIETFLWEPEHGAPDIDLHLERMCKSAGKLQFKFESSKIKEKIHKINSENRLRCRLTLTIDGKFNLTTAVLQPNSKKWIIGLSNSVLSSADPWLLHKSSNRELYDTERAKLPDGLDELIYLNERKEVCEGTSGCLPGVLRRKKIEEGSCKVGIITFSDLKEAEKITVGNALRGEIDAVLSH